MAWLAAALPAVLAAQDADRPERGSATVVVTGVAIDRVSRSPIEGVTVTLGPRALDRDGPGSARPVQTDDRGRFTLPGLRSGLHRIEVRRLGYATIVDSLPLPADGSIHLTIEMVAVAIELEGLLVVSRRSRRLESAGFYGRQDRGLGRFLTREEIDARNPSFVTDLLRIQPGVRVVPGGSGERVFMRGGCVPEVFLDGARTVRPFAFDEFLTPDHIEGIEVYAGAQIPVEYSARACGAILVWTRMPDVPQGSPFSIRRTLAVLGGVAAFIVLLR